MAVNASASEQLSDGRCRGEFDAVPASAAGSPGSNRCAAGYRAETDGRSPSCVARRTAADGANVIGDPAGAVTCRPRLSIRGVSGQVRVEHPRPVERGQLTQIGS